MVTFHDFTNIILLLCYSGYYGKHPIYEKTVVATFWKNLGYFLFQHLVTLVVDNGGKYWRKVVPIYLAKNRPNEQRNIPKIHEHLRSSWLKRYTRQGLNTVYFAVQLLLEQLHNWAVVVAQLVEQPLPTPEVCGLLTLRLLLLNLENYILLAGVRVHDQWWLVSSVISG